LFLRFFPSFPFFLFLLKKKLHKQKTLEMTQLKECCGKHDPLQAVRQERFGISKEYHFVGSQAIVGTQEERGWLLS